jgi:hypothetical protein
VVLGGSLVVPMGLIRAMTGQDGGGTPQPPADTQASAARARAIVMEIERRLGFDPTDREFDKLGYDIESRVPGTGRLRFIEVKGRVSGAPTITVTRNEILYSLNKPEDFILAIVEFLGHDAHKTHYLRQPFQREPDFGVTSVNYDLRSCSHGQQCRDESSPKTWPPALTLLRGTPPDRLYEAWRPGALSGSAERQPEELKRQHLPAHWSTATTHAELVYQHLKQLLESVVAEVLDFVQFLEQKHRIPSTHPRANLKHEGKSDRR